MAAQEKQTGDEQTTLQTLLHRLGSLDWSFQQDPKYSGDLLTAEEDARLMRALRDRYFSPTSAHLDTETTTLLMKEHDKLTDLLVVSVATATNKTFHFAGQSVTKDTVFRDLPLKLTSKYVRMVLAARCFFQAKHGGRKAFVAVAGGRGTTTPQPQGSARAAAEYLRTVQESILLDRATDATREELSAALRQLSM